VEKQTSLERVINMRNDGLSEFYLMRHSRRKIVLVCENIDFYWSSYELKVVSQMWKENISIQAIADFLYKDEYSTFLACVHLARNSRIKHRHVKNLSNEVRDDWRLLVPDDNNDIYILCEEMNFVWCEFELAELKDMLQFGMSHREIADYFERDPDEILIASLHLDKEYKEAMACGM
jgi:hypothetical protein